MPERGMKADWRKCYHGASFSSEALPKNEKRCFRVDVVWGRAGTIRSRRDREQIVLCAWNFFSSLFHVHEHIHWRRLFMMPRFHVSMYYRGCTRQQERLKKLLWSQESTEAALVGRLILIIRCGNQFSLSKLEKLFNSIVSFQSIIRQNNQELHDNYGYIHLTVSFRQHSTGGMHRRRRRCVACCAISNGMTAPPQI